MLNWSLLQNLLILAIACSSITVIFIQKVKRFCRRSKHVVVYSFFINMILGFLFCQTFTNVDYINSLWVGLFSFLGADTIYKSLEGKLSSYTDIITKQQNNTDLPSSDTTDYSDIIGEINYE